MHILVVGAGATGGYFGGRLAAAGRDVTFLVRSRRAEQLATSGLVIKSPHGDATIPNPKTVLAEKIATPFDLIVLSCKAYDLDGAIASFAPAVGPNTIILPLLNGMRHLDVLDARFGKERVFGGQCVIAATLDDAGTIVHLNKLHGVTFGERDGKLSDRAHAVARDMIGAGFEARLSENIVQEMWEKWVFLATLAGSTCLMRAAIGDIMAAPSGKETIQSLYEECRAIADANEHAPRDAALAQSQTNLTASGSTLTASMLRDIEKGGAIEADHIVGDLIARRKGATPEFSVLALAYTHMKAYEARRGSGARLGFLSAAT